MSAVEFKPSQEIISWESVGGQNVLDGVSWQS